MHVYHEPLLKHGLLRNADPSTLRSFGVRACGNDANGRAILAQKPFLRGNIAQLSSMALALQYLAEESVRVFCDRVQTIVTPSKGGTKKDQIFSPQNAKFQALVMALEGVQGDDTLLTHPKMHALRNVLLEHFQAEGEKTRAMVFCSYREVVTEIVTLLQAAGLRATPFIGQATDKKGNRGFTQKVQEQILADFQNGTFQVLVATSIGEEGLDIGEVDLIVCYEAVRDSVRALQRVGRTGRMRDGRIVVLMTEGREEHNWQHSKDSYKNVQRLVRSANTIELYTDVDRLVPEVIKPEPVMCEVAQPKFEPGALKAPPKRRAKKASPKEKQNGNLLAFCSASELRRHDEHREGGPVRTASSASRSSATANLSDDSDDAEIASGLRISSSSTYTWPPSSRDEPSSEDAPRRESAPSSAPCESARPSSSSVRAPAAVRGAAKAPAAHAAATAPARAPATSRAAPRSTASGAASRAPRTDPAPTSPRAPAATSASPSAAFKSPAPPAKRTLGARRSHATPSPSPAADRTVSPYFARYAPHPLVAELAELSQDGAEEIERAAAREPEADADAPPLFFLSQDSDAPLAPGRPPSPIPDTPPPASVLASGGSSSLHVPSSPPARAAPRKKRRVARGARNMLFDEEAERETDSDEHGESDEDESGPDSSDENDEDRAAVGDFPATQQAGYNQEAVYLQSMLSQRAPTPFRGRDRLQELLARRAALRPSSEADIRSDDEYSNDSFVVGDDEIEWADSSDV